MVEVYTAMYAIVQSGGKQYRVAAGDKLRLEKLSVEQGDTFDFDRVLLLSNDGEVKVGRPYVEGVKVSAEVVGHGRGKKVEILKFKRRKHHMKRMGHRQAYTEVKITQITE
jgi:large subunit ribosomal protein L21